MSGYKDVYSAQLICKPPKTMRFYRPKPLTFKIKLSDKTTFGLKMETDKFLDKAKSKLETEIKDKSEEMESRVRWLVNEMKVFIEHFDELEDLKSQSEDLQEHGARYKELLEGETSKKCDCE